MTRRSGPQMSGSRPNGPTGTLPSARVATQGQERLAERMPREALLEEDPSQIGMTVEFDAEHVVGLALAPVRAFPDTGERGNMRIELGARRAQHREDLRRRPADERHRPQLGAGTDARVHRVEIAARPRIVAQERRDLNEPIAIDVDDEHVVKRRDASLVPQARGDVLANSREIGSGPRRAQYQFNASFFHA